MDIPVLAPRARIPGQQRERLAAQLAGRYNARASIRELCAETGYSIGRVRRPPAQRRGHVPRARRPAQPPIDDDLTTRTRVRTAAMSCGSLQR